MSGAAGGQRVLAMRLLLFGLLLAVIVYLATNGHVLFLPLLLFLPLTFGMGRRRRYRRW